MGSLQGLQEATLGWNITARLEYQRVSDLSNGELYRIPAADRQHKVSPRDYFRAGEFLRTNGVIKGEHARILPALLEELDRLRFFLQKPVKIITGYMSADAYRKYEQRSQSKADIALVQFEKHHVRGAAAKIKCRGFDGPTLAKYITIACSANISIGIGKKEVILVAEPKSPHIFSFHSKSRRTQESVVKVVRTYFHYFNGIGHAHAPGLHQALNNLYGFLKPKLLLTPNSFKYSYRGMLVFAPTRVQGHIPSNSLNNEPPTPQEKEAIRFGSLVKKMEQSMILLCKDPGVSMQLLTELLFYSRYFQLFRAYFKSASPDGVPRQRSAAQVALSVQVLRKQLCASLQSVSAGNDLERASKNAFKYNNTFDCTNGDRDFGPTLLLSKTDQVIFQYVQQKMVAPYYQRLTKGPAVQYDPELDGPKANRQAIATPDKPVFYQNGKLVKDYILDITGRYELLVKQQTISQNSIIGQTFVVNQAGNHIEGIVADVWSPLNKWRSTKRFYDAGGDLEQTEDGQLIFRMQYRQRSSIDYVLVKVGEKAGHAGLFLQKHYTKVNKSPSAWQFFRKLSNRPVLMGAELQQLNNSIVRDYEWFPLLEHQINFIKKKVVAPRELKKWLDPSIDKYMRDKGFFEWHFEIGPRQQEAAREIENQLTYIFLEKKGNGDRKASHPNHGIHPTDARIASYYFRSALSFYAYKNNLTRLDYLMRIFSRYGGGMNLAARFLNATPCSSSSPRNCKAYRYEVTIQTKVGLSGSAALLAKVSIGGVVFKIIVKKIEGKGNWPIGKSASFYAIALNLGAGIKLGKPGVGVSASPLPKSMSTTFTTDKEWWPDDFPGQAYLTTVSVGAGKSTIGGVGSVGVKKGFYTSFDIYSRTPGDLRIPFVPGGVSVSFGLNIKKPNFKSTNPMDYMPKPSASADGNFMIMKIMELGSSVPKLKPIVVKRNYEALLDFTKRLFFIFDSALLTPHGRQLLRIVCCLELRYFLNPAAEVKIVGLADRVGERQYNVGLSKNRALNTAQALQDILGKKLRAKLKTEWIGERKAATAGDLDELDNPRFRGAEIYINGNLIVRLGN